jgi:multidrug efflux pump subunit AcrB
MSIEGLLRNPHAILSATLVGVLLGVLGFMQLPINLFPDTNRPTISVVSQWPGAAADDVTTEVTHPMEVRLSAIDGVRRVTSTSRDGVSSVQVEFEYGNPIDIAANKVTTELSRVVGLLPDGVLDPLVFKITDAARPVVVLAATAAPGIGLDLSAIRRIAENPLRDVLLNVPGVAEVEVFGGPIRQVAVDLDRNRIEALGLVPEQVAAALVGSNLSLPSGLVHLEGDRFLLTTQSLAKGPEDLAAVLVPLAGGDHVRIGDIAAVHWGAQDPTSLYRGNGKAAVAIALLRSEQGTANRVVRSVEDHLTEIRSRFPSLDIQIADTQGRLIDLTVSNMLDALRDAVIMTIAVILLFIGNSRAAFITALSLPFTYLLTFASMYALGYEFDMVTLSAVIIAVGLLADDAVVVIENIERRMRESGEQGLTVAIKGTREILLADTAGTVSTVIVLIPIMFIGGYVQTVLRPLTVTLSIALIASLVVSVSIIPLLVPWLLKPGARDPLAWLLRPFSRYVLAPIKRFYGLVVAWGLQHRLLVLVTFSLLFIASAKQMQLLGRELMPMMDTGIIKITYEAQSDTDDDVMADLARQVEQTIAAEVPDDWIISISNVVGAEPSVKSFGASRRLQQGEITVNLVDRFHRDRSIYTIEQGIRSKVRKIPGLISANVTEFGATPLSSLRATLDIMISGPDPLVLDRLADDVMGRLTTVRGLTGIERSWQGHSERINLDVDPARARLYGLTAADVARQVANAVGGMPGGKLRVSGENSIPVWVRLEPGQRADPESLRALEIRTPGNVLVPLLSLATPRMIAAPTAETHQALVPTVDVLGFRRNIAVTGLHENVAEALVDLPLPRDYVIRYEGEYKQLTESFTRLGYSLLLGIALLYLMLVVTFRSFLDPFAILFSLPLAVIGAAWAMMIANKHGCMPSFMGLILLMGIVVNNGILLIDFAKVALAEGKDLRTALLEAVEKRTRPILMTAAASAVGMIPIALEWAVGIERLSPLAVVAIGGLIAGTFLTLLAVPVFFHLIESGRQWWKYRRGQSAGIQTPVDS